jgi:hypothetical protein
MIDQRLYTFDEAHGVRQIGVNFECFFADPAGMNKEEPGVSDRSEGVNTETARLFAGGKKNIVDRFRDGRFIPQPGLKAPEDVQLHAASPSPESAELMTLRWTSRIPVLVYIAFTATLFGQIDSYQFRAKYGPPLARETFTISPDFHVIVDYGPDQQVCRLELPPSVPSRTAQQVDDALLELVPMSVRGRIWEQCLYSWEDLPSR